MTVLLMTSCRACPVQSGACATLVLHLSHNLEEPRPRRAEVNGPAEFGGDQGTISWYHNAERKEKTQHASLKYPSQRLFAPSFQRRG